MRLTVVAFLAGVWLLAQAPRLPDRYIAQFLPLCLGLIVLRSSTALLAAVGCGFLWATVHAHIRLGEQLPAALEGRDLVVEGVVADIPRRDARAIRFLLEVDRVVEGGADWRGRVRLHWYRPGAPPPSGQRLGLRVRLARPRGFLNPGGFDYEGWLFARRIAATGYVRNSAANGPVDEPVISLDGLRQVLVDRLEQALPGHGQRGFLQAIALGVRHGVTPEQWEVLRATGTAHLMAISGLHVGLVAAMAFGLVRTLWRLTGVTVRWLPAGPPAAVAAIFAAAAYAALAGFSVPTQRALVMVTVAMVTFAARRSFAPSTGVAIALLAVLLLDPMAVISPGFWLSFVAVAAILYGVVGYGPESSGDSRGTRLWWRWGRVHWLISVALLPLTLLFFGRFPWLSPLANLVAVPWVGVVVVPCALLGTLLLAVHPVPATAVLQAGAFALDLLWPVLEGLAALQAFLHGSGPSHGMTLATALVGAALLLMPRGVPARVVGLAWLLPLLWPATDRPAPGELWLTILDVGQGLAIVAQTHEHALLYDAGPRYSEHFDAGSGVIVPFLRHRRIRKIDTLVVSHGHADHVGGVEALLERGLVTRLMANSPDWPFPAVPCQTGQHWRWDGIAFEILYPARAGPATGNDASCVLRIATAEIRILLPGDVEHAGERALVATHGESLGSSVLLLAHHGSHTSTGPAFLDAVGPCVALISRGHRNRFGFPDARVLNRLAGRAIPWLDTAVHGAIEARIAPDGKVRSLHLARVDERRFWHRYPDDASRSRALWLERVSAVHACSPPRGGEADASPGKSVGS